MYSNNWDKKFRSLNTPKWHTKLMQQFYELRFRLDVFLGHVDWGMKRGGELCDPMKPKVICENKRNYAIFCDIMRKLCDFFVFGRDLEILSLEKSRFDHQKNSSSDPKLIA